MVCSLLPLRTKTIKMSINIFGYITFVVCVTVIKIINICWLDGVDTNESIADWNSTEVLRAIPQSLSDSQRNCYLYRVDNTTAACSKWVYDSTYHSSSRAIEWNLVCDRRWMGALAQTVFMLGVLVGAIVLGGMADKYGRKNIFTLSAVLQIISGITVAFTPEYWSFLVIRFFYGVFGAAGTYITAFVLLMEIVGAKWRTVCGIGFQCGFSLGIVLVGAWGFIIHDRLYLQVAYGLHGLLLVPHIWLMDESPRWLWAQGRAKESIEIVEKALNFNKSNIVLDKAELVSRNIIEINRESKCTQTATTLDLFKTPNLRRKTLNMCLCYFANSLVYYGLSLSAGKLNGNPFIMTAALGFVELPSYGAVAYFLDLVGRRILVSTFMLLGGVACIYAPFATAGSVISTVVVMIGKSFITGSFGAIFNYSAELFPTVVRNSALGLGSMCARISAALTPMVTLLDSFDPKISSVLFGAISLVSGTLVLFLPETMNKPLPQSLVDGEKFGKGDTLFTVCGKNRKKSDVFDEDKAEAAESMLPLKDFGT